MRQTLFHFHHSSFQERFFSQLLDVLKQFWVWNCAHSFEKTNVFLYLLWVWVNFSNWPPAHWWVIASDLHFIQFQRLCRFGGISWSIPVLLLPRTLQNIWDLELKGAAKEPMLSLKAVVGSTVDFKMNNKPPSACKNCKGCQVFWAFKWEIF